MLKFSFVFSVRTQWAIKPIKKSKTSGISRMWWEFFDQRRIRIPLLGTGIPGYRVPVPPCDKQNNGLNKEFLPQAINLFRYGTVLVLYLSILTSAFIDLRISGVNF
jgi:hypothetical protein